jgi:large subunit ribosomal protein L7/L12
MSDEGTAVAEYSAETKQLGDKISGMTLKQAKELSDYLKDVYGIEPATGGGVMVAAPTDATAAPAVEQTEFDVFLTAAGDKKLNVVKVVKNITGASLMDAKKMVESAPVKLKEKVSKEEAAKVKAEVEESGGSVEIK